MTDVQMMEDVRDGKVERLTVLFERHHVPLFNFFLRLTGSSSIGEDLVQDVFYRILNYRHTYKGQSKFTTWMYQIARNTHIDYLRKKKDELPLDERWDESLSTELTPNEKLEKGQDVPLRSAISAWKCRA